MKFSADGKMQLSLRERKRLTRYQRVRFSEIKLAKTQPAGPWFAEFLENPKRSN